MNTVRPPRLPRIPSGVLGNLAATSFRLALLFLVGREVASQLGSQGIVVMGQLQNLLTLGLALASQALQPGIQQALGSARPEQVSERSSWALLSGQILALLSGLVVLQLSTSGAIYLPPQMHAAAWMLVPGLMAMAMMGNLQAIASGTGRLRRLNLFIALSGPLQALWLYFWIHGGLQGLVPGVLLFGLVALPLALWLMPPFPLQVPRRAQWKEQARLWAPLAAMGSVVAVLSPYKLILFRETILAQGVEVAGNWQAAVRITDLLFATWSMAFTTWALPKLSGPEHARPKFGKLSFGPLGGLALAGSIAVAAPWILDVAYVGRFPGALPVLRLQCFAEFVQSCTMPLGLILIARRSARVFAGLEFAGAIAQIALVRVLVPQFGPIGAPIAICIESTAYFAVALWFVRRKGPVQE